MSELSGIARSKRTSVRLAQRAHIVLLAAQGPQTKDIAKQPRIGRVHVARGQDAYVAPHKSDPKLFKWTKKERVILHKVIRANRPSSSKQNETMH